MKRTGAKNTDDIQKGVKLHESGKKLQVKSAVEMKLTIVWWKTAEAPRMGNVGTGFSWMVEKRKRERKISDEGKGSIRAKL